MILKASGTDQNFALAPLTSPLQGQGPARHADMSAVANAYREHHRQAQGVFWPATMPSPLGDEIERPNNAMYEKWPSRTTTRLTQARAMRTTCDTVGSMVSSDTTRSEWCE